VTAGVVERWIDGDLRLWDSERQALYWTAVLFASHPFYPRQKEGLEEQDKKRVSSSFARALSDFAVSEASTAGASIEEVREPLNRKFIALLDSDQEDLFPKLRRMIALLRAAETPIDWQRFVYDINAWNLDSKKVQHQWARDWWNARPNQGGPALIADANDSPVAE